MMSLGLFRSLACPVASWRAQTGKQGNTTARWQDKGARCAPWFGRAFSRAYAANSQGAPDRRSLRLPRFSKIIRAKARCATARR